MPLELHALYNSLQTFHWVQGLNANVTTIATYRMKYSRSVSISSQLSFATISTYVYQNFYLDLVLFILWKWCR